MHFNTFLYAAENDLLLEQKGGLKFISKQQAINRNLFGPVYHGTSEDNLALIKQEGFKTIIDIARSGDVQNGYLMDQDYAAGKPAPVHHLGYGVYFTTSKTIAKEFNRGTTKGLIEFYLNVPRLETINYAAPHTMMNWWMSYGYDMPGNWQQMPRGKAEELRMKATIKMTRNLKKEFDAVWFSAKSLGRRNLDGDQVCVYDPKRIYAIDPRMSKGLDVGAKVTHSQRSEDLPYHYNYRGELMGRVIPPPNVKGVIVGKKPLPPDYLKGIYDRMQSQGINLPVPKDIAKAKHWFTIKWAKGGTQYNYTELDLIPVG